MGIYKKHIPSLLTIIFIFSIDRLSKLLIIKSAGANGELNFSVTSFLKLNFIWNEGIAFGLFSFNDKLYYNLLSIIILTVILILIWLMLKAKGFEKFSFLMIIGGSLGNFFDRIYYSAVPDFIDIHFKSFHWFIFNVADIFITVGIFLLIIIEILRNKKIKNENL